MKIERLATPPFNTTLMGVLKGVLDYYGIEISDAMLFGASGHAFLINIHEQLCPSGPYCWRRDRAAPLIENLGLRMTDLGFCSPQNSEEDRAAVEAKLRDALDEQVPCSLINLENQLITGYDETGFFTTQPWAPKVDFPPATLSFGSWAQFGDTFHVNFYIIRKVEPVDDLTAILAGLDYAVDLHATPTNHSQHGYGIAADAYTNWISAVAEHGSSHGNLWNATVWSECRQMASRHFAELAEKYDHVSRSASELSARYAEIGNALNTLGDKEMDAGEKIALLEDTKEKESTAIKMVAAFAASLRSGG